jgi:8-oxo-dGTP diphosphatase
MSTTSVIEVAAGVIVAPNDATRYLLCQRAESKKYPLQWEFPGGKVEIGEQPLQTLQRELAEELHIEIQPADCRLLCTTVNDYPLAGIFKVHFYLVQQFSGEITNTEFNAMEWVKPEEFSRYQILEGNREVCSILQQGGGKDVA